MPKVKGNFICKHFHAFIAALLWLFASLASAQEIVVINIENRPWSVADLSRIQTSIPVSNSSFATFVITKNYSEWRLGGNLGLPEAELIYVDRLTNTIGPFSSSIDQKGEEYLCSETRAESKQTLALSRKFSACRSEFYSSDKAVKIAQAVIMCAILACIGGYSSDWWPIFRPLTLKTALGSGRILADISKYFKIKDLEALDEAADIYRQESNAFMLAAEEIFAKADSRTKSMSIIKDRELTKKLRADLQDAWNQFLNKVDKQEGLQLGLNIQETSSIKNSLRSEFGEKKARLNFLVESIDTKLMAMETAERAKRELLAKRERTLTRSIQTLLVEYSYSDSIIDGSFGPKTIEALKDFFTDLSAKQPPGGKQQTLDALRGSVLKEGTPCPKKMDMELQTVCFSFSN
jgi:hypothetical protein